MKPAHQVTAPLLRERFTEAPAFEVIRVDFAGPLMGLPNELEICSQVTAAHALFIESRREVVLIGENNVPRQIWKMGRVTELFPGRDGLLRSYAAHTSSGSYLWQPVEIIYPLEIVWTCFSNEQLFMVEWET
ncbi:hypothetical protein CCH79_00019953, partial [Gambusia affinis]